MLTDNDFSAADFLWRAKNTAEHFSLLLLQAMKFFRQTTFPADNRFPPAAVLKKQPPAGEFASGC